MVLEVSNELIEELEIGKSLKTSHCGRKTSSCASGGRLRLRPHIAGSSSWRATADMSRVWKQAIRRYAPKSQRHQKPARIRQEQKQGYQRVLAVHSGMSPLTM